MKRNKILSAMPSEHKKFLDLLAKLAANSIINQTNHVKHADNRIEGHPGGHIVPNLAE